MLKNYMDKKGKMLKAVKNTNDWFNDINPYGFQGAKLVGDKIVMTNFNGEVVYDIKRDSFEINLTSISRDNIRMLDYIIASLNVMLDRDRFDFWDTEKYNLKIASGGV